MLARPDLGARIAMVTSQWAIIENDLATAFALLLLNEEEAAFSIFIKLIDRNLREAAFLAVLERKSPELCKPCSEAFRCIRKRSGERNDIAHGMWGYSDEYPDAIILVDQPSLSRHMFHGFNKPVGGLIQDGRNLAKTIGFQSYTDSDFKQVLDRLMELRITVMKFVAQIGIRSIPERLKLAQPKS
jgi:hypothetical protein